MLTRTLLLGLPLLAIAAVLLVSDEASATGVSSEQSCSWVYIRPILDLTAHVVWHEDTPTGFNCFSNSASAVRKVQAGASFVVKCSTQSSSTPPPSPDTTTISIYDDDTGFRAGAGAIRSQTTTVCPAHPDSASFTFHCTSDGTSTGSPRFGPLRLFIRAQRAGVGSYDDNSESANAATEAEYGVVLCTASGNSMTDTLVSTGSAPTLYQGGDSLRQTLTLGALPYKTTGNMLTTSLLCPPSAGTSGAAPVASLTVTRDSSIAAASFAAGCDLQHKVSVSRMMALNGWTGTPYSTWHAVPAGAVLSNSDRDFTLDIPRTTSYTGSVEAVVVSKTATGAANEVFVIGADQEFIRVEGYRDPRGDLKAGATVTCTRTRPDMTPESPVAMGSTDASGDTSAVEFAVVGPSGTWTVSCTGTFSGNSATAGASFIHASALTSQTMLSVNLNATLLENGTWQVNTTVLGRMFDASCDCVAQYFADGDVLLTVQAFDPEAPTFGDTESVRVVMQQLSMASAAWNETVYVDADEAAFPVFFFVTANMGGRPFIASASFLPPEPESGGDATFTNLTVEGDLTLLSTMEVETAADEWIPLLVWGGLVVAFLYFVAWLPAVGAIMSLMNELLPSGMLWAREASVMLVVILLVVHVVFTRGLIPTPWGRKGES